MGKLLVRSSGSHHVMTEPQGKSNLQRYEDMKAKIAEEITKLRELKEGSKSYQNKEASINKLKVQLSELEKVKDKIHLSDSCITHLVDLFVSWKYGRREELKSKFIKKGNLAEEDAITLLTLETKKYFKKNDIRLSNEYLTGEPDIFEGESIYNADAIWDTKSSYSAHTFFRAKFGPLNYSYYWQGQSYMALTGAKVFYLCYCLVNSPIETLTDEIYFLKKRMNVMDIETEEFIKQAKQVERNHIFDLNLFIKHYPHYEFYNDINEWVYDIPRHERVHIIKIERNDFDILRLYKRIDTCFKYIDQYINVEA